MKPAMRFSKSGKGTRSPTSSPANTARKALLRRIQRQELRKLQSMLPGSTRSRLSAAGKEENPVAIINSVIHYIHTLHATIVARVRQGTLPPEVLTKMQWAPATAAPNTASATQRRKSSSS